MFEQLACALPRFRLSIAGSANPELGRQFWVIEHEQDQSETFAEIGRAILKLSVCSCLARIELNAVSQSVHARSPG
jgi:hypothetical protein